ncbi:Threonylcarbamoyl-AMP_synthase [Hexamita inflata]|uniref:Threonylcarbamoyl-AMP synthase n=1 Tax=Hexamita inflata TaxID=28002 RepID=A0AA86TMZ8_9EUKA|nr:Threonylcarbamoyl-AMP synthase [Hexamita inflata]
MPILEPTKENIKYCADLIKADQVIGMPTETVYGLAANAFSQKACEQIYITKQRPPTDPLIVHVSSLEMLQSVCVIKDFQKPVFEILQKAFWPGPLTFIFQKSAAIPLVCTANQETVGVRFPVHPVALQLIEASGPLAAPSANLFGHVSPTRSTHVSDDFSEIYILNGDQSDIGIESTVLMIRESEIFIFRKGFVTKEKIQQVLQQNNIQLPVNENQVSQSAVQVAPGCLTTHYAINSHTVFASKNQCPILGVTQSTIDPTVQTWIINCADEATCEYLISSLHLTNPLKQQIFDDPLKKYFDALRFIEKIGSKQLIIIPGKTVFETGKGEGTEASLFDRIFRSASGKWLKIE